MPVASQTAPVMTSEKPNLFTVLGAVLFPVVIATRTVKAPLAPIQSQRGVLAHAPSITSAPTATQTQPGKRRVGRTSNGGAASFSLFSDGPVVGG
jgi:hypothetical protein